MTKLKNVSIIASLLGMMLTDLRAAGGTALADAIDIPTEVPQTPATDTTPAGGDPKLAVPIIPVMTGVRPRKLTDLFRMASTRFTGEKTRTESQIAIYTLTDLTLRAETEYWRPYERYFEATIMNTAIEIVCAQQGAAHLIRNFSPDTLTAYATEVEYPFNDPVAPYHDANYEFRSLSQDVAFIYTTIRSGMALQCQLRRDDAGKPAAMFIHRFTRLIVGDPSNSKNQQLLSIDTREVDDFFRTFGAFCKIACGAQGVDPRKKFYYVWAQRQRSDFTQNVMARTLNLLLQEEKRVKVFFEQEQLALGIHPTQNFDMTFSKWASLFMNGYDGGDPKTFTYRDPTSGGAPQGNREKKGFFSRR